MKRYYAILCNTIETQFNMIHYNTIQYNKIHFNSTIQHFDSDFINAAAILLDLCLITRAANQTLSLQTIRNIILFLTNQYIHSSFYY